MSTSLLDQLFPEGLEKRIPRTDRDNEARLGDYAHRDGQPTGREEISGRWQSMCSLELRGFDKKQIAEKLGLAYGTVVVATNNERYKRYRAERLAELDDEFHAMKPLALDALRGGLTSADENTALRASEQWFKAASFGGFSKTEAPPQTATAEDVARALMLGVQVNVNVNTDAAGKSKSVKPSDAPDEPQREALKSDEPPGEPLSARTEAAQLPLPLASAGVE